MKKTLVGLAATTALSAGLVASGPAEAAPERCPYTGCIATVTVAVGPVNLTRKQRPNVRFKVKATGNAAPAGFVKVVVHQKSPRHYYRAFIVDYQGGRGFINGHRIPKIGKFTVRAKFIPDSNGPFRGSKDAYGIKVVREKKK